MKKRGKQKSRNYNLGISIGLIVVAFLFVFSILIITENNLTGNIVGSEFAGNPESEQICMQGCVEVGCESGDMDCMTGNREKCMAECGAQPAPQNEGERCMNNCVDKYCEPGPEYLSCMDNYKEGCEDECDMKGDAPDESEMSAEQLCISNCVAAVDPELICGNSQSGETGNDVCQRCANECVHLYEGPCLNDEQLREKEKDCETCEHCYGSPVTGPSGEGWDCIVDVECKDASGEFGDEAGTGPGIGQEGYEEPGVVGKVMEGIANFFKGLFGGGE